MPFKPSKNKPTLEMARVEYLKSTRGVNEVAREFGLPERSLRAYLHARNEVKPEHQNKSKHALQTALKAIELVQNSNIEIPRATQAVLRDFAVEYETYKGNGFDFAIKALDILTQALNIINPHDLDEVLKIERLAATAKTLSDMLGVYPKAPTIAIQNNLQQNLNNNQQKQSKDNALRVEIVEVDDK